MVLQLIRRDLRFSISNTPVALLGIVLTSLRCTVEWIRLVSAPGVLGALSRDCTADRPALRVRGLSLGIEPRIEAGGREALVVQDALNRWQILPRDHE